MVGGIRPDQTVSNVYKLYRACRTGSDSAISRKDQLAFYDAGLGADEDGAGFWSSPVTSIKRLVSMALGIGISENVADCYETILKHYQPGDRIFLIGFSRGAYTVRNVAGVLSLCGIPEYNGSETQACPRTGKALRKIAEEAVNIYEHGASKDRAKYEAERNQRAYRFRQQYGSWWNRGQPETENRALSNVAPYFIGAFDTVAALGADGSKRAGILALTGLGMALAAGLLGWLLAPALSLPWLTASSHLLLVLLGLALLHILSTKLRVIGHYPAENQPNVYWEQGRWLPTFNFRWHIVSWRGKFFDKYLDNRTPFARHAIAIDEHRADFGRVPWGIKNDQRRAGTIQKPTWFRQLWFAGSHSDVGGGFPEAESGLSDITLQWMVEQLKELPDPVIIQQDKLQLDPDACAIQHCAVHDVKDAFPLWWPSKWRFSWQSAVREIPTNAILHPSVLERFEAAAVLQYDGHYKPYRPAGLREHDKVKHFYAQP